MKVLYITYDGLTDPLGQSQILPYLTSCSSEELTFHILSFEKEKAFKKEVTNVQSYLDQSNIDWTHRFYTKRPALLSSIFDLNRMIRRARKIIKKDKIDLVHCRGYMPAYAAFKLKRDLNIKVLFDMRGFWADERMEGNIWQANNFLHRFLYSHLKVKERSWWKEADHMISLTNRGAEVIMSTEVSVSSEKITIIPCCADEKLFWLDDNEKPNSNLRERYGLKKTDRILIYVGSLGTWYMSDEMMSQFSNLYEKGALQHFIWISKEDPEIILELAKNKNVPTSAISIFSASRNEVASFLSMADIGIFYIRPTFSKKASSPTKLGEMLLSGLPVIANSGVGDLDEFFKENEIGYIHDIENESEFIISNEVIENLLEISKSDIREIGIKKLSLSYAVSKYVETYTSLG